MEDPATAPHERGVLVIDDTGDRKDGTATAHVARQYLGSVGKIDNGIVAVTSLWADERCYWPVHAVPYTPASRLPRASGIRGSGPSRSWRSSWSRRPSRPGIAFRAVVADCFYGDNPGFTEALAPPRCRSCWPSSPARAPGRRPSRRTPRSRRPASSAGAAPSRPGQWRRVTRRFRDGHTETWWAADAQLGGWGPDRRLRLVVATTDPARLPGHSTWYLLTNLPRPAHAAARPAGRPGRGGAAVRAAQLGRAGLQAGQGELGWADFQVRTDRAIRRHWTLVCCAFSFCWQAFLAEHPAQPAAPTPQAAPTAARGAHGDRASRPNRPSGGSWPVALRRCGPG